MKKYVYIKKDAARGFVELGKPLDKKSYPVGTTWQDFLDGKWVLLSAAQVKFREDNPSATVKEVWEMQMEEHIEPTPEPSIAEIVDGLLAQKNYATKKEVTGMIDEIPAQKTLAELTDGISEEDRAKVLNCLKVAGNATKDEDGQSHRLKPNVYYDFGEAQRLDISLGSAEESISNTYRFGFNSPVDTATTLTIIDGVEWSGVPKVNAGHHYEVEIFCNTSTGKRYGKITEY